MADSGQESLRHIVAGMLSTIDFVPSQLHPGNMLDMADKLIHHIRLLDSEVRSDPGLSEPNTPEGPPEGPFEGQDARY